MITNQNQHTMKKNLYYRTVFRRENVLLDAILDMFFRLASYPRMLLEVFIRTNMGERYFSLATAITLGVILLIFPVPYMALVETFGRGSEYFEAKPVSFWGSFGTWYVFLLGYAYAVYLRWQETRRGPSVFDFSRFSLSGGNIHPLFYSVPYTLFKVTPSTRSVEIFLEPLFFLLTGIVLGLFGQYVGTLIFWASIFYFFSYWAAYRRGDNMVMDRLDEMILNEEMEDAFVNDQPADKTRGVRFLTRKPRAKDLRRKLTDSFIEETAPAEERTYAE